jgi:hypothetical protein
VLHVSEGCKAQNVGLFVEALKANGGDPEAIERCSMDMANTPAATQTPPPLATQIPPPSHGAMRR